jgi:hypothetical protein
MHWGGERVHLGRGESSAAHATPPRTFAGPSTQPPLTPSLLSHPASSHTQPPLTPSLLSHPASSHTQPPLTPSLLEHIPPRAQRLSPSHHTHHLSQHKPVAPAPPHLPPPPVSARLSRPTSRPAAHLACQGEVVKQGPLPPPHAPPRERRRDEPHLRRRCMRGLDQRVS